MNPHGLQVRDIVGGDLRSIGIMAATGIAAVVLPVAGLRRHGGQADAQHQQEQRAPT